MGPTCFLVAICAQMLLPPYPEDCFFAPSIFCPFFSLYKAVAFYANIFLHSLPFLTHPILRLENLRLACFCIFFHDSFLL